MMNFNSKYASGKGGILLRMAASAVLVLMISAQIAQAQQTWTSINSGMWNNAANWQTSGGATGSPPFEMSGTQTVIITDGHEITQLEDMKLEGSSVLQILNGGKLLMGNPQEESPTFTQIGSGTQFIMLSGVYESYQGGSGGNILIENGTVDWQNSSLFTSGNYTFKSDVNNLTMINVCQRAAQNIIFEGVGTSGNPVLLNNNFHIAGISGSGNCTVSSGSHIQAVNIRIKVGSSGGNAEFFSSTMNGSIFSIFTNDQLTVSSMSGNTTLDYYCSPSISGFGYFQGTPVEDCALAESQDCETGVLFSISGTVFNDPNGGTIDGTPISAPGGEQLYVSVIDAGNNIVNTVAVAANGTYSFGDLLGPGFFTVVLHLSPGGSSVPALPDGWINTAEGVTPEGDGTPDGIITDINLVDDITTANFGIQSEDDCSEFVVSCPDDQFYCSDELPVDLTLLTGTVPAGGTFFGPGVSSNSFNNAAGGPYTIGYAAADGNCMDTCYFDITVFQTPEPICPDNAIEVCVSALPLSLNSIPGFSPSGGIFAGHPGISGAVDNQSFSASPDVYILWYVVEDPLSGCVDSCDFEVIIYDLPELSCTDLPDFCEDDEAVNLMATPVGGTWSGPGVDGETFDPAAAGPGEHILTYTYTDENGCTNSCNVELEVFALPVVTCPGNMHICLDDLETPALIADSPAAENDGSQSGSLRSNPPEIAGMPGGMVVLTGGSPSGGSYSGDFVTGDMFDAFAAGPGTHTVTYEIIDENGCTASCTFTIHVTEGEGCFPIPTTSEWGLIILALLMLQGIWLTLMFRPVNVLREIPVLWFEGLVQMTSRFRVMVSIVFLTIILLAMMALAGIVQTADFAGIPLTLLLMTPTVYWYRVLDKQQRTIA